MESNRRFARADPLNSPESPSYIVSLCVSLSRNEEGSIMSIADIVERTRCSPRAIVKLPSSRSQMLNWLMGFGYSRHTAEAFALGASVSSKSWLVAPELRDTYKRTGYTNEVEPLVNLVLNSFGDPDKARKMLSPLYAHLRSGIPFRMTAEGIEVKTANGWREIAEQGSVTAEEIGNSVHNFTDLTALFRFGEMMGSEALVGRGERNGRQSWFEEGPVNSTWLLTNTGVPLYPSEPEAFFWTMPCHQLSTTVEGDFSLELWLTHDNSAGTSPAKLFRVLMDEAQRFDGLLVLALAILFNRNEEVAPCLAQSEASIDRGDRWPDSFFLNDGTGTSVDKGFQEYVATPVDSETMEAVDSIDLFEYHPY